MASSSTVPAVIEAFKAAMEGLLPDVRTSYGPPLPDPGAEYIWVHGVPEHERRVQALRVAPHPIEEEYVLVVVINVLHGATSSHKGVVDRAYEILDVIETFLRSDLTVGGALTNGWAVITAAALRMAADDEKREAEITVQIRCRARI